jgi:hypothetical protein
VIAEDDRQVEQAITALLLAGAVGDGSTILLTQTTVHCQTRQQMYDNRAAT